MVIGELGNNEVLPLEGVQGDALEIIARFTPKRATHFGLAVRMSPDHSEITRIEIDRVHGKLVIDNMQGTLNADPDMHRHRIELDFPGATADQVDLRIFLDRSVIEVFGNRNEVALTGRTYPTRADSQQIAVWTAGGRVQCDGIDVWKMKDITVAKR